jgi:hypothetical protein
VRRTETCISGVTLNCGNVSKVWSFCCQPRLMQTQRRHSSRWTLPTHDQFAKETFPASRRRGAAAISPYLARASAGEREADVPFRRTIQTLAGPQRPYAIARDVALMIREGRLEISCKTHRSTVFWRSRSRLSSTNWATKRSRASIACDGKALATISVSFHRWRRFQTYQGLTGREHQKTKKAIPPDFPSGENPQFFENSD